MIRSATLSRLLAAAALTLSAAMAHALTVVPYSAQALADAQKANAPVVLHFHASWCPTCRAQDQAIETLKADPTLNLTLLVADYDKETALKTELKVRQQSTFIVYHGATERQRSVGVTDPAQIRAQLKAAL